MKLKRAWVAIVFLACLTAPLPGVLGQAIAEANPGCPVIADSQATMEEVPAGLNVIDCGLIGLEIVHDVGALDMIVQIPFPGERTTLVADGTHALAGGVFAVEVDPAGAVSYPEAGDNAASSSLTDLSLAGLSEEAALLLADGSSAETDPCKDKANRPFGPKWKTKPTWFINQAGRPSNISAADAEGQIRQGKNNVSGANNNCGRADNVNRDADYGGTTTVSPDISSNPSAGTVKCTPNGDSISVVGFGPTPTNILGFNCNRISSTDGDAYRGGDILISNNPNTFVLDGNAVGCVNRYDLQALVTHEFGHFFGLNHVSESKHGTLTMSPKLGACTRAERTLGLGDLLGLESLY